MRRALALLLLATLASAGCLASAAGPGADPAGAPAAATPAPSVPLGSGDWAMEPHVAIRVPSGGGDARVVVAHMADVSWGPGEDPTTQIEVHRSVDGGATWTPAWLPRGIFETPDLVGAFGTAGDPVLAYAPDGALYLAGVAARGPIVTVPALGPCCLISDLSVFVTKSLDDGLTWSPAVFWAQGVGPSPLGVLQDKPWLVVSPDGIVHLGWTEFTSFPVTTLRHVTSRDGGATWSAPATLAATAAPGDDLYSGLTFAAPGGGRVYASYSVLPGTDYSGPGQQVVRASADDGATWSAPVAVGSARFPRYGQAFTSLADPRVAHVLVADESGKAYLASTADGGASWSAPLTLVPHRAGPEPMGAGFVGADGAARVVLYDEAWPGGERVLLLRVEDGAVVSEEALGAGPIRPAERRREYMGVATDDGVAWAAWVGGDASTRTWIEAAPVDA